jgi:hypothetical protein
VRRSVISHGPIENVCWLGKSLIVTDTSTVKRRWRPGP